MADVSGIGTYTTSFTLPESWDENTGCYISFTHGDSLNKQLQVVGTSDMVTQIIVNGHEINRINSINDTVDIGNYLQQGTNVLEIKLDTTNWNRMSLDGYYRSTPWLEQSKNVENGLKTVTLTPYTEVELTQAQPIVSIDAPESVQVNEPFAVTVAAASDVTALKLFNEYGLSVAVQNSAVVKNADGTKTWTLDTAMGTVGNGRTLTVAYRTDENYYTQGGSFTLDITSVPPILESFTLPDSAVANRTFIVQATTDMEAAKIVVYNEFGAKMGIKSLSCKVVDGQKVWTGVMAIGTKGDRTLTAYAVNKYGVKSEALTDTVTVKAFA